VLFYQSRGFGIPNESRHTLIKNVIFVCFDKENFEAIKAFYKANYQIIGTGGNAFAFYKYVITINK